MKTIAFLSTIFFILTTSLLSQTIRLNGREYQKISGQWHQVESGYNYRVDNSLITVKFKNQTSLAQIEILNQSLGAQLVRKSPLGFYDLQIPGEADPMDILQNYSQHALVEIAEPNTIGEYLGEPNDPRFSDQWFHETINTPDAWDWETGGSEVIVGVLDSGTDILHEDLKGNIWVNPGEDLDDDGVVWDLGDINGVDNDGNGFVDDLVGWDFGNNNNDVEGPFYHGTHVAGIAGAVTNNNKGVAGVAGGWYSTKGIKMLICGVGDSAPNSAILDDAILYAASEGVDVITMSLSVGQSSAISSAIETAHNTYGCFINCASGNNFSSSVRFPASAKYVFAVGATTSSDQRASFSNYGDSLDVVAPGVDIWSTQKNNSYNKDSGTSYASPQIAGIAALLKSHKSTYTNEDIEMIIATSAEKVGGYSYNQTRKHGSWNNQMGYGRVNAFYTVAPPAAPQNLAVTSVNDHPHLTWEANTEPDVKSGGKYKIYFRDQYTSYSLEATIDAYNGSTPVTSWTDYSAWTNATNDQLFYKITAMDNAENESDPSNEVQIAGVYYKMTITSVDNEQIPRDYSLSQNYPNPFNPTTTITFTLPESAPAHLQVFDLNGKLVAELLNRELDSGRYKVSFDASHLGSGIYVYRLTAGKFIQSLKMTLLK